MEQVIIDISVYQGEIDYALLASKANKVIMRSSIGLQEDWNFVENYAGLYPYTQLEEDDPNYVELGLYHGYLSWLDAQGQADFFSELIEGKNLKAGVWADFERDHEGTSQFVLANMYYTFLQNLESHVPIGIYTAAWFWNVQIGVQLAAYFLTFPLWFAHYTNDFDNVIIPVPWKTAGVWYLHQYSADGNNRGAEFGVESDDIDISRVNPEILPPPIPEPTPTPDGEFKFVVVSSTVRCRTEASTNGGNATVVGQLSNGDVIVALGFKTENGENFWVKHLFNGQEVWSAIIHRNVKYMDFVED